MRYGAVITIDGHYTFLSHVEGVFMGLLHDERKGNFPLERVLGVYATIREVDADMQRIVREADAYGDWKGLPNPIPCHPLKLVVLEDHDQIVIAGDDEYTREFFTRKRPVFFMRLLRQLTVKKAHVLMRRNMRAEVAYAVKEAILKQWTFGVSVSVRFA